MQVRKAVFPVAGFGTRMLPATKALSKEMLPIIDKPLIQYAVEEAAKAGITEVIFVVGSGKALLEKHFSPHDVLENHLLQLQKHQLLNCLKNIIPSNMQFTFIDQPAPLGLGAAILLAESAINAEPFVVLLPDILLDPQSTCLQAMCAQYQKHQHSIVTICPVSWNETSQYGIVRVEDTSDECSPILSIVEKPKQTASNLAVIGRYLFTPDILDDLRQVPADAGGEKQLTDGIKYLLQRKPVYGYLFTDKLYDCGSKFGYMQAMIELGMQHHEIGEDVRHFIRKKNNEAL